MGIISIKSTDNLFWLGRYVERVFTTLRVFSEYYDKMIDKDENAYIDFCNKLGIENTYSYKQEFITKYLFPRKMEIPYIPVWSAPMTMRWYCGMN